MQEFSEDLPGEEHELDIEFDYLRGADGRVVRHRNPDEADADDLNRAHARPPSVAVTSSLDFVSLT